MNTNILIAYTTMSGSTVQVAQAIADGLARDETSVDLQHISKVRDLTPYNAVVLGAPMILGWHRDIVRFIVQHQDQLKQVPVAYFSTQLNLTRLPETQVDGVPVFLDPKLAKPPANPEKMKLEERLGTPASCLGPAMKKAPLVKPISAGFFGGKLDYSTLKLLPKLFVKIIIRGEEGDFRNWDAIGEWVKTIQPKLV